MARGDRLGITIRRRLTAAIAGHGFGRRGAVWIRQTPGSGGIEALVRLELDERGDEWLADAVVGVRSDAIERTLAELRGHAPPRRRETPSWYRRLSRLHGSPPEIRQAYGAWRFSPGSDTKPALEDFESALTFSAMPVIESASRLDGLLTQMEGGRIDGDVAWRLPVVHLLRGDPARARETLEQATRWARRSEAFDAEEYRRFALAVVRRLGDAALVETPCEEIVSVLRPALRAAFPDRAGAILAQLVRSFWWEAHPASADAEHCSLCGTTDAEAALFGGSPRICDTCVSACAVLAAHPGAAGARIADELQDPLYADVLRDHATRPGLPQPPASSGPPAATLAADAVRALRAAASDEALRLVPEVERRLLAAPADRPPEDVCVSCGPLLPPARRWYDRRCAFCRSSDVRAGDVFVDAGRTTICRGCAARFLASVPAERRLE